jgi:hypothetical protein
MMSVELHIEPGRPPGDWEWFLAARPAGSIALDGYLNEPPRFEPVGPYMNIDHHSKVDRMSTLSTAQQVLRNIRMGMTKAFADENGQFRADVWVNDCDEDVCTSWFLLNHVELSRNGSAPNLNRFVEVAGTLDATSGAFPYDPNLTILEELAWIFEPYSQFRISGEMSQRDERRYRSVIDDVEARIQRHLMGRGDRVKLDTRHEVLGGGKGWAMIKPIGKDGRIGALMEGIDAYVSVQELAETGKYHYSVGRRSAFIPFDVPGILNLLNDAEGNQEDPWGGSDIIGGSPRLGDSRLTPREVEALINDRFELAT